MEITPRIASAIRTYNEFNPKKEIKSIQDLAELTEADVLRIPGCGRKMLNEIKEFLAQHELKLTPGRFAVILENKNTHLTLRDQFAMAALTGLLANPKLAPTILREGPAWFDENAFAYADAMMEARK